MQHRLDLSAVIEPLLLQESGGYVQFGLELIDVFESVSNIKAFMRMEQGSVEGSLVINGTILSCT